MSRKRSKASYVHIGMHGQVLEKEYKTKNESKMTRNRTSKSVSGVGLWAGDRPPVSR